jgi:CMP-N-acetylneuraminic acid synthetase
MIVALIPARGGSKRLPRKNLRLFAGRPLISYSINFAKRVSRINKCFVSTEDEEIASVARSLGADVIDRPAELADDFASTFSVVKHALQQVGAGSAEPEALVLLQPNCPLRPKSMATEALDLFFANSADSVVSVSRNERKLGEIKDNCFVPQYQPGIRSQDLAHTYFENGLIYVTRPSVVRDGPDLFGKQVLPLITDPLYALGDIDTELDFQIAEFIFTRYRDHFDY